MPPGPPFQAFLHAPYLRVVLGPGVEVFPALVLTRASEVYDHVLAKGGTRVTVASADMLFNVFDEGLRFLG